MERQLVERNEILKDLIAWHNPNYGIDEQWARFYPYGQRVKSASASPPKRLNTIELQAV